MDELFAVFTSTNIQDYTFDTFDNLYNYMINITLYGLAKIIKSTNDTKPFMLEMIDLTSWNLWIEIVRKRGYALDFVPVALRTYELCLAALKNHGLALYYVPKKYTTEALIVEAVAQDAFVLLTLDEYYYSPKVLLTAVLQNKCIINHIPQKYLTNKLIKASMRK